MAERLETLPAKQVAWVRFPVAANPTYSVEKLLFFVTLPPGARCKHCNCTVYLDKKIAVASSLWRLEAGSAFKSKQWKAKVSHILRSGNNALKGLLKLVNGFKR
jgi:hypothetical protein